MRNFVPSLEESLMKFSPSDITRDQPEATYTAHGGWFGVESLNGTSVSKQSKKRKLKGKGARA